MTLIKSISGIRGTIGGKRGDNLTPIDIVESISGFGQWLKNKYSKPKVVIGRDGRITGNHVKTLSIQTLIMMGIDIVDLDLSTTPTVEMAVLHSDAHAGIIITASHNPEHWNALKFVDDQGEFISAQDGADIIALIQSGDMEFASVDQLGVYSEDKNFIQEHIKHILQLDCIDIPAIKNRQFNVVVDCINSTGAIALPPLLDALGCSYTLLNDEVNGRFAHNPEPLPENLIEISSKVVSEKADLGIVVDPDVDRLAFVCENGDMFGEEFTLVGIADYLLEQNGGGNSVSNLSSTKALKDVTEKYGGSYYASAVGEVNVVQQMKACDALIGGEGNGGVILPELHYGRDALVGIAIMLSLLARKNISMSDYKTTLPTYFISKDKIALNANTPTDSILQQIEGQYKDHEYLTIDGLKIMFEDSWVHLRKSNTEPIIRIYAEAPTAKQAKALTDKFKSLIVGLG